MSFFDKLKDKLGDTLIELDEKFNILDKVEDSIEVIERRGYRRIEKISEGVDKTVDTVDAVFAIDKYKNKSIKERAEVILTTKQAKKKKYAEFGDIIGVERKKIGIKVYEHYGIYIGNNRVIHYSGERDDFSLKAKKEAVIREDDLSKFIGDNEEYFILNCEESSDFSLFSKKLLVIYSPHETVSRAMSKLGENEYDLAFNNCEHFSIWCKTGIKQSNQISDLLCKIVRTKIDIPKL